MLERHSEKCFREMLDYYPADGFSGRPLCPGLDSQSSIRRVPSAHPGLRLVPIRTNESPIDMSNAAGVGLGAFRTDPTNYGEQHASAASALWGSVVRLFRPNPIGPGRGQG